MAFAGGLPAGVMSDEIEEPLLGQRKVPFPVPQHVEPARRQVVVHLDKPARVDRRRHHEVGQDRRARAGFDGNPHGLVRRQFEGDLDIPGVQP